jgi:hypothetical protein
MESGTQQERKVRAARNESLFRSVNEKLETLNEAFESVTKTFAIACECADATCVEMIHIEPDEYRAVRADPRRFAVRPAHVLRDVETVVSESARYLVVEKTGTAGETAEAEAETEAG